MPLVKNGKVVDDSFVQILDDTPIADDAAVIVPAARLLADAGDFANRSGRTGVLWPNDRPVAELAPLVDRLALVALVFPTFRDGRAYSQARLLRERYHFRGELRATGQVLRDQFLFLQRAGFDVFEVKKQADALAFVEAVSRFSVFYQPAADGQLTAFRRRLAGGISPARIAGEQGS
jgi:uncharacterized protein (DUF934 family)